MKYTNNTIRINVIFILCIVLLFVLFSVKLAYVNLSTIVEGTNLTELAKNRSLTTKTLTAQRGRIYDVSGDTLAQNVNSYTVIAILSPTRTTDERYPKHVVDKEKTAEKLSEILLPLNGVMTKKYILELLNRDVYQVELGPGGKGITERVKKQIEAASLPGIIFSKTYRRYYQKDDFASYVIGYVRKYEDEMVGELGIEQFCNRYLKGKDGSITYEKDAYGYPMAGRDTYVVPAEDGYDVYLTLDSQVQIFLDNAVQDFLKYNPEWVTLTVADAKTGAIIASSTTPSFNPNISNVENYNNPLTSFTYEPGSTMKIFSFMSAIEENKYNGSAKYSSGSIQIDNYKIRDWNKTGWGTITFDTGFTYSSNVAAVLLTVNGIGKNKLINYYNDLGFGAKTGIELGGELAGEIDINYKSEVATASFGQGITITPIQMVQALTTITNDGTVLKPYIIDKIVDPNTGKVVYQSKRKELKKVYSTATVNKIIELMDLTVNGEDKAATGRGYHTDAVRLIGKTGTANYTGKDGKYVKGTYNNIRSFAGVFPKENPEYIIYVAVKDFEGNSKSVGGIIKNLVESVAKYRNLDERPSDKDENKIVTVPNLVNKSTLSAETKLNALGLNPIIIGDGNKVVKQFPNKSVTVIQGTKTFVVTNGKKVTMPNIIGWSSTDVVNFAKLVGIPYTLNGYGYVKSTNLKTNDIIDDKKELIVELENIEPGSLVNS